MSTFLGIEQLVKRVFDIALALFALLLLAIPMLCIAIAVRLTSSGPALYRSDRVGKNNKIFRMPKFRTMRCDAPQVATHLLVDRTRWLTPIGRFLRATSLDELPQLWSILVGHMSFVGPRPALYNQHDLIKQRTQAGVHRILPGLTGWAQVNGRDELSNSEKVALDAIYLARRSFALDVRILVMTFKKALTKENVVDSASSSLVIEQELTRTEETTSCTKMYRARRRG